VGEQRTHGRVPSSSRAGIAARNARDQIPVSVTDRSRLPIVSSLPSSTPPLTLPPRTTPWTTLSCLHGTTIGRLCCREIKVVAPRCPLRMGLVRPGAALV